MTIFIKPFRVKSNTQMKGSDKKKLKASLKKSFPNLTDENLNTLLPTKEEIVISKIFTFNEESVLLYIHNKNTVFFEMEKDKIFFPSIYTLWKYPEVIPFLTTWPPVMSRIANGADLMLPGVIVEEEKGIKAYCDGRLAKGDLVSVNLQSNKAPVAVGTAWLSSEDMYMAARKGKCVNTIHFYGDQLWAAGTREQIPDLGGPDMGFLVKGDYYGEPSEEEEGKAEVTEDLPSVDNVAEGVVNLNIDDKSPEIASDIGEEPTVIDNRTPQEIMDELLENAFLQSLKTSCSAKKAEFPMLTSNFFRLHMVPACPPDSQLDVKKSSYKKLSKFLEKKEKFGLLKIKELAKGVESIMSVDYEHEQVKFFRVMKHAKPEVEEAEPEATVLPCDKKYEPPKIVELYTVTANVLKLFKTANIGKGKGLTAQEVRQVLTEYVKANQLKSDTPGMVRLDELLAEVVMAKGDNSSKEMKWEDLQQFTISKMSPGYSLQFQGEPASQFKGQLDPVELTTATRSGNKKVTLVNNLDTYQIDPSEFAHKCQVYLSVGTTSHPAPNRKSGTEVMIQGNHVAYAAKLLLEEYKINKKYIKGVENAGKPKKKK
eukprot:TRINITY_DN17125_c0_g1_i2.p1 TRINITY_DN17125_c0_g1~~TRINITY_DN17125_c0_g1_i2.p1  ORF type:complete len:597 (-),score=222.65 TRINITY_DN17125_c0_g1_i2:88-1878(-)